MDDGIKMAVQGAIVGGLIVFAYMQQRPANPYEVCLRYWGQKFYSEGDYGIIAEQRAEGQCQYEKTAFDGDYSNG